MDIQAKAAEDKMTQQMENNVNEVVSQLKKNEELIKESKSGLEGKMSTLESTTKTGIQTDRNDLESDINSKASLITTYATTLKDNETPLQENSAMLATKLQQSMDADMKASLDRTNKSVEDLKKTYLDKRKANG